MTVKARLPRGVSTCTVAPTWAVHQRFADRRLGREAAFGQACLGRADQRPDLGLALLLVAHLGGATEGEGVRRGGVGLDDDRVFEPFAQALDPRLHMRLVLFGDVVLGVLLEVAFVAGGFDPRRHRMPFRAFELLQLGLQLFDSRRGDRLIALLCWAHGPQPLKNALAARFPMTFVAQRATKVMGSGGLPARLNAGGGGGRLGPGATRIRVAFRVSRGD